MASSGDREGSAAGDDCDQNYCDMFRCFCCWRRSCSPRIPRVMPGRDYVCMPACGSSEDDHRTLSVLVGCTSFGAGPPFHNLRVHRFRVAQSGRVIGQSDDLLEPLLGVSPSSIISNHDDVNDGQTEFYNAMAALGPDSKHLYIICVHWPVLSSDAGRATKTEVAFPPKVFRVDIAGDLSLSPMGPLPFTGGSYGAISAHNGLWVPVVLTKEVERCAGECTRRLFLYHLVDDDNDDGGSSWTEVTSADFQYRLSPEFGYGGTLFQGYAVISDRFILLSFINSSFFCFDCATGTLVPVVTTENGVSSSKYVPISGKGVHFEGAIYFIRGTRLFAYRYDVSPLEGRPQLLAPPIEIDTIWPYDEEGYGFLVHLAGRILCAVWINMNLPRVCATRNVVITTFSIKGVTDDDTACFMPSDVEVLHSTCRRICMLRTEEEPWREYYDIFCFLQEYPDAAPRFYPSVPSELGGSNAIHQVEKLPDMLSTCRDYPDSGGRFDSSVPSPMLGGFRDIPELDKFPERMPDCCREFLSRKHGGILSLEDCNVATRSDFYFICQVDQRSLVYQISNSGGKLTCNEKADVLLCLDTVRPGDVGLDDPPAWFFVHRGSMLDVIPSLPYSDHYAVDVKRKCYNIHKNKRSKLFFSAVFQVGEYTVALCHTLQDVYVLNRNNFQWRRQKTSSRSLDLSHKVKISGFVDLGDNVFMISDAETFKCFLFDLKRGEWSAVKPPRGYIWQYAIGLLNGRSIFMEGFIYTCSDGGLIAFELIDDEDDSYCLGEPIMLNSSWEIDIQRDRRFLSFDSIGKGENGSSIVFCVVQGCPMAAPFTCIHYFAATTVHVKLKKTLRETKEPISIDRVDVVSSSIDQDGTILTNYAFAV